MATTRYYRATDGHITVFRATTREYQSAWFTSELLANGWHRVGPLGFSGKAPPIGKYPATEITKQEYDTLQAAKIKRTGADARYLSSPQDSWVRNADLEG